MIMFYQLYTNLGSFILFYSFNIKYLLLGRKSGISPKKSKYMSFQSNALVYQYLPTFTQFVVHFYISLRTTKFKHIAEL